MLNLERLFAVAVLLVVVAASLPTGTQCDTSYYEKYYAARRFMPQKRASLLDFEFSVTLSLGDDRLTSYERIALVGDVTELGGWRANDAVLLNRSSDEHNVWKGVVSLPTNASLNYRYFVAAVDANTGAVQVRRWESHISARSYNIGTQGGNATADVFGYIGDEREVQRGWLNSGRVVQFKLFRDPLQINEIRAGDEQLRIRLQPVEPQLLTPILPSARAHVEYVRMEYGNSWLRTQPEFGVPYENEDILIFEATLSELQGVAYLLQLYASQEGSDLVRLIGYQHIYPDVLVGSEGNFTLKLLSPVWLNSIGTLDLQYLVVAPSPQVATAVDFRTTFLDYWRGNWTAFDLGHRGLGKSLKQLTNAPAIIENTVASMKASGDLGTDFVEFDVQLTSDLIPVIYHDFYIYVCMDPKTPTSKDDLTEVLIKDVTYEQLKNLKTYQVVGTKIVEYPAHNTVEQEDHRLFPSFEDFLTKINKSVGFDIEIKWPQMKRNGALESVQTIDKNLYVDRILEVMQRSGCGRMSFFTSFDADICTLLRYKQNMYPTMFLFSSTNNYYADPRSGTIYDIVNNAQAFDLAGVVPNAIFISLDPNWVQVALKQQKKIFLWGDVLKDDTSIEWFKQQGPTGVIYDRLDLWLPLDKQNAFDLEDDLPQFFQMQCSTQQNTDAGRNVTLDFL